MYLSGYSATAVGVNSFVRCVCAAITTIFSSQVVAAIGNGVLFTILAAIGVANGVFVIATYYRGTKWRRNFEKKYMPDLYIINDPNINAVDEMIVKEKLPQQTKELELQLEKTHTHQSCIA